MSEGFYPDMDYRLDPIAEMRDKSERHAWLGYLGEVAVKVVGVAAIMYASAASFVCLTKSIDDIHINPRSRLEITADDLPSPETVIQIITQIYD